MLPKPKSEIPEYVVQNENREEKKHPYRFIHFILFRTDQLQHNQENQYTIALQNDAYIRNIHKITR